MTYEDIIDLFALACAQHYQINEFSTSPLLSDLEVGTKGTQTPAVYPYVFLQPIGGTLAQGEMQYQFNLIVMDRVKQNMDKETNTISDMIQIGQDIIAYWNFSVPRPDAYISLPLSVAPFVERFDNILAGATFTINVNTPFALDKCIAPFRPVTPVVEPVEILAENGNYIVTENQINIIEE